MCLTADGVNDNSDGVLHYCNEIFSYFPLVTGDFQKYFLFIYSFSNVLTLSSLKIYAKVRRYIQF